MVFRANIVYPFIAILAKSYGIATTKVVLNSRKEQRPIRWNVKRLVTLIYLLKLSL